MKLVVEFARAHPWSSLGMLGCLVVAAVAEGAGLSALLPLLGLLLDEPGQEPSALEQAVQTVFAALGVPLTLEPLLAFVCAAFVLRGALVLLARRQIGYTVARVMTELRLRLVRALMKSRWGFYVRQRVGTFANAYAIEIRRSKDAFMDATQLISFGIELCVYLALALATSWQLTLGAAATGAIVVGALSGLVRRGRRAGHRQTDLFASLSERLTDTLQGVKPLKAMAREDRVAPLLDDGTRTMEKAMRREIFSREAIRALQEPLLVPFLALGVFAAVRWLGMPLPTVMVLGMVAARAFHALNKVQRRYQRVAVNESAYWSLVGTIEEAEAAEEKLASGAAPHLDRGIELCAVRHGYGDDPVLRDLSLEIPARKVTAIAGPSGSGKTTLLDLICGLIEPETGEVRIDGTPLSALDGRAWRRRIGYVPQETFLFHDSVEANVSLGDPAVTREQVERALRAAHAWEFVSALPGGLDASVGERGTALSGGQRQRIAIARALLHEPWLLILDEATAALDPESEAAVWETVRELRGRTTVLAVSHQPALLGIADAAWRLKGGRVEPVPLPEPPRVDSIGALG